MTKDVLITIKGLQYENEDGDQSIETINRGSFYDKGGKRYVTFEESPDGEDTIKSLIRMGENSFEISRRGAYRVNMLFETGKKNSTDYATPYGNLVMGIDTESITYNESEDSIEIIIIYDMEMNYQYVAKCRIEVKIDSIK